MTRHSTYIIFAGLFAILNLSSCKTPQLATAEGSEHMPASFTSDTDSTNTASQKWAGFFNDPYLLDLISIGLKNNQELGIALQEIEIARNDVRVRKGELLPMVNLRAAAGTEKVGRYTSQGAGDASTEIRPGQATPDPLSDFNLSLVANWEVDIWKKLRNSKKAAFNRYLGTIEGRNFVQTNLIAEIAGSYYELLALDAQLEVIRQNVGLQQNALEIVKVQKQAARATELGVQKFEAEVRRSQSLEFGLQQQIAETENRLNFLLGRYPQEIPREKRSILDLPVLETRAGLPSQLLENRPDVRQAEQQLQASKLDVKAAKAAFYPRLGISASLGVQSFNAKYLSTFPESLLYSMAADLITPLVNRNAIKAEYSSANARQLQAVYQYRRTMLNAYLEVVTQLSRIENLRKTYEVKFQQVEAMERSISASNDLFRSARIDYFEVLMTQRDALEARLELMETRKSQMLASVNMYRDLGGGWK